MATLTVQKTDENGGITFAAATAGGDDFPNDGRTLLVVRNASAGAITVGVTAQVTEIRLRDLGDISKANGGGSVAAGGVDVFGPFPERAFNATTGRAAITYSAAASVTVAAVKLP